MCISVSPLQLLHGFVVASIEVFPVSELLCRDGLLYVISGILAGGIPGFRIVLCCFTHATVWQCDCCVFLFSFLGFAIPIPSWYNAIISFSSLVTELDRRSPSSLCVGCVCFCCFVWFCFCVFCCFGCCFLFSVSCEGIVTAAGLCTGPIPVHFCGHQQMAAMRMH